MKKLHHQITAYHFVFCFMAAILFLSFAGTETKAIGTDAGPVKLNDPDSLRKRTREHYVMAISEYLRANFEKHKFSPDTLFIGIIPEEPEIDWPETIDKVPVRGITIEASEKKMKQTKSWSNVNVVSWPVKNRMKFLVVTFLDGGTPQHNCHLYFKEGPEKTKFKLDSLSFEYCYKKK